KDGRILRPAADDLGLRRTGFEISANAADEAAAANRDENGVNAAKLFEQFDGNDSLPGYNINIVVRRDEHFAGFFRCGASSDFRFQGMNTKTPDVGAESLDALRFAGRDKL